MGDVGSSFLGALFAGFVLHAPAGQNHSTCCYWPDPPIR